MGKVENKAFVDQNKEGKGCVYGIIIIIGFWIVATIIYLVLK